MATTGKTTTAEWALDSRPLALVLGTIDGQFYEPTTGLTSKPFDAAKHLVPFPAWPGAADPSGLFKGAKCWPVLPLPDCPGGFALFIVALDGTGKPTQAINVVTEDTAPAFPLPVLLSRSIG